MVNAASLFIASTLATVFAISAVSKARSIEAFDDFSGSLSQFGMRGWRLQRATAALVVALEAAMAAFTATLMIVDGPVLAWRLGMSSMCGFIAVLSAALVYAARSLGSVRCQCFGASDTTNLTTHLFGNAAIFIASCTLEVIGAPAGISPGSTVLLSGLGALAAVALVHGRSVTEALSTGRFS